MNICFLNLGNYGSTGNIVRHLADMARAAGNTTLVAYPDSKRRKPRCEDDYIIESEGYQHLSGELSTFTGLDCCFAYYATIKLLRKLDAFKPDIIHLHNIHGWYVNIILLFRYIKKHNIRVVWTLHDCWAFTGHCPHFQENNCTKWVNGCKKCELHMNYPKSYLDNSKWMYAIKKQCFVGVKDLTIVTPSEWLASLVKRSFLGCYPCQVINNGIDLTVFCPRESDFRVMNKLENKKIVLGVASQWNNKKGLDVFIDLANHLDDRFQVVLVGTTATIDKVLPGNIITIHRTNNQEELAEIYSSADVFVNPTREDTFPTVNIEALACGTPVITFDVGGSPEILDETCGVVVKKNDLLNLLSSIERITVDNYMIANCITRSKKFEMESNFRQYVVLYSRYFKNHKDSRLCR